jgi:hypothetical protein
VVPVQLLDIHTLPVGNLKDEVLDQVGGKQGAAAVVERLEDDLGVVTRLQIDDNNLEMLTQRADEGVWRLLRGLGWSVQRPARRAAERDEAEIARWRAQEWPRIKGGR